MRVAVEEPSFLLFEGDITQNFYGYQKYYTQKYAEVIYTHKLRTAVRYRLKLKKLNMQNNVKIVISERKLNKYADVLIGFNTYRDKTNGVEKFNGIKIYDIRDHHMQVRRVQHFLETAGVDYLIAGGQLDQHSTFFNREFSRYNGKVLSIPYGYAERFKEVKPFGERINKAVGLGSINLVNDQRQNVDDMKPVVDFFRGRTWTHETRAYIALHADEFEDCIDSFFPSVEQQKDFSYDAVERLNQYTMFINDAGNFNFPAIRTYEGIACGCVMVAAENPIYEELGFIKDVNYIAFAENDFDEMKQKIRYYMENKAELEEIQKNSLKLAKLYSQELVADRLQEKVKSVFTRECGN